MDSTSIIQIRGLKTYFKFAGLFRKRYLKAIDGLDLNIRAGESLGIVGESGSGKTTLAKNIVGLLEPTAGEILFAGRRIAQKGKGRQDRPQLGIVFQDPYSSLNPKMTIYDVLSEPLIEARTPITRELLTESLSQVGIPGDSLFRYPHEFSGGQRQRIAIARAIINHPEVLILDEPTSGLDVSVQAQILNLLLDFKRRLELTYLFISHNLGVIYYVCNRIAVMYHGKIVELADSQRLIAGPAHPYTIRLLSAVPEMAVRRGPVPPEAAAPAEEAAEAASPSPCSYYGLCPLRMEVCRSQQPPWHSLAEDHFILCHRKID
jgi:peptide/nickel transport system ATP-binding protein